MRAKERNNLTEGSVLKSLIALSVPIILANILQTAYQLTDTFWVGRLGAVAVAAVSISFPIIFFIILIHHIKQPVVQLKNTILPASDRSGTQTTRSKPQR